MITPYKLAFIGGGMYSIAGYPHFIASQMDRRFEVVAAAFSTDPEINRQTGEQWGIQRIYNDWKVMVSREAERVHAFVVMTPTPLHQVNLVELLALDVPVICEKPLVASMDEIRTLESVYNPDKHFLVITNNYSGYPMVRELQHKIRNQELGRVLHIRLKMPQESFLRPPKSVKYPQKWRLTDGEIPMISLDLGAHLHHLGYFLLQEEPGRVMATYDRFSKYNVVDNVNMLLEYESGIQGSMWLSKTSLGNRNGLHIEVYGSDASAMWHQETPEKLAFSYASGQKVILDRGSDVEMIPNRLYSRMTPGHPAGFIESFANLYNDIADALDRFHAGQPYANQYVYDFEHARNGLNLLACASLSNQTRQWVDIAQNQGPSLL